MAAMRTMMIAGVIAALGTAIGAWAGDQPVAGKIPPPDITVKIQAPEGTTEQDIAVGIATENARRDPVAQEAARVAKSKADAEEAHHERISKICDSIPEKSLADDPSLRRLCGE
jgi:hypothetical protein